MDILRRSLELGLGALALTRDKAEQLLDELSGPSAMVDADERERQVQELLLRGRQFADEFAEAVRKEVAQALARSGLVRREEYDALQARVDELERRLAGAADIEPASDL